MVCTRIRRFADCKDAAALVGVIVTPLQESVHYGSSGGSCVSPYRVLSYNTPCSIYCQNFGWTCFKIQLNDENSHQQLRSVQLEIR